MERKEQIAKLCFQYANLVDDKDIDKWWAKAISRDRWYDLADEIIKIFEPK